MNNNISSEPITIALKLLRLEKVDTITKDERDTGYCLHLEDRSGNLCYVVGVPVNNIISIPGFANINQHLLGFIKSTKVYLKELILKMTQMYIT